jgi:hypothetical protein
VWSELIEKLPMHFVTGEGLALGLQTLDRITDSFWNLVYYIAEAKSVHEGTLDGLIDNSSAADHMDSCKIEECVVCATELGHAIVWWFADRFMDLPFTLSEQEDLLGELPEPIQRYIIRVNSL